MIGQLEYGSLMVIHTMTGSKQQGGSEPESTTRGKGQGAQAVGEGWSPFSTDIRWCDSAQ